MELGSTAKWFVHYLEMLNVMTLMNAKNLSGKWAIRGNRVFQNLALGYDFRKKKSHNPTGCYCFTQPWFLCKRYPGRTISGHFFLGLRLGLATPLLPYPLNCVTWLVPALKDGDVSHCQLWLDLLAFWHLPCQVVLDS